MVFMEFVIIKSLWYCRRFDYSCSCKNAGRPYLLFAESQYPYPFVKATCGPQTSGTHPYCMEWGGGGGGGGAYGMGRLFNQCKEAAPLQPVAQLAVEASFVTVRSVPIVIGHVSPLLQFPGK